MRTRKALRILQGGGARPPKALLVTGGPGGGPPHNRVAYWIVAEVTLPDGRRKVITREFATNKRLEYGAELQSLEELLARNFQAHDKGVPIVGAEVKVNIVWYRELRTFYHSEEQPPMGEAPGPSPAPAADPPETAAS